MTTVVRWQPIRAAVPVHNELSRLMNGLFEGTGRTSQAQQSRALIPALDAWETRDEIVFMFDLPGIPEDKIAVEAEDGTLTVSAERTRTEEITREAFHRYERRFGTFSRSVALPQGVADDSIKASYSDGVLEVRVTKPVEVKPRKIEVSRTDSATAPKQ